MHRLLIVALVLAAARPDVAPAAAPAGGQAGEQTAARAAPPVAPAAQIFFPLLTYRTGAFAAQGAALANGTRDYYRLVNARNGGVQGVAIAWKECETGFDTRRGLACYEKLLPRLPALLNPLSSGLARRLGPRARVDRIPLLSVGYGHSSRADGRVFPWQFVLPTTPWGQAAAFVAFVGAQIGGLERLPGTKLAHLHHNSANGREANPVLRELARRHGFELRSYPVAHPGLEQAGAWREIQRFKPQWVLLSGWGEMNAVAIRSAASIGLAPGRLVGNWRSGSEDDVAGAGASAIGYRALTINGAGADFPVHRDIVRYVYANDVGEATANRLGEVLYNRGLLTGMYNVEAVRGAIQRFGPGVNGAQVRWGIENLRLDAATVAALGMRGLAQPLQVSCAEHTSRAPVAIQRWDGQQWSSLVWHDAMPDVVGPMAKEAAAAYEQEHAIDPVRC